MSTLRERLDGLQAIVNTAEASTLIRDPEGVALRYAPTGMSYRPSPKIARWAGRIVSELASAMPVTGYVVGDFGYGKTSAALHLARRCEAGDIVAVPPAIYDRIEQMAEAMHAWVRRALDARVPTLVVDLDAEKGRLPVRPTANEVVQFARACTHLVRRAGYAGLLFIVDELQQYINNDEAGRVRIQGLSRLVQGVRDLGPVPASPGRAPTPGTPFGLIMLMPASPTEGILREQADDMMQRMEERETALHLDDAYGEAFVRDVWAQVCEGLADPEAGRRCMHDATFVALGNLVARRDLSNGPRTMMQAFKQIAARADAGGAAYTALDLARDYEAGHLVFDGPSHRIRSAISSLLRRPEVHDIPRFERAALLLAVFPEGITEPIADQIDGVSPLTGSGAVASTFHAILDLNELHLWIGRVTYQVRDGAYALVSLQPDARPEDVLTTLVRNFSARYLNFDAPTRAHYAIGGFMEHVVPHMFEARTGGKDNGFGYRVDGTNDWSADSRGVAYRILQGAPGQLFKEFPDRRLCVAIGTVAADVRAFQLPRGVAVHMVWRFALVPASALDVGAPAPLVIESSRGDTFVDLRVPLGRMLGQPLPPDLDLLKNRVAPERTNVQLLLALIFFAHAARGANTAMSGADQQEHEQLIRNLTREVARLMLPDATDVSKVQVRGVPVGRGGLAGSDKVLLESLFATKCRELFPEYRPLAGYGQWSSNVTKYVAGLRQCTLAERRGQEQVGRDRKADLAGLFGLANVGFDTFRAFCKERGLLGAETRDIPARIRGQEPSSTLVFTESPAEVRILAVLEQRGRQEALPGRGEARHLRTLEYSVIRDEVGKAGYLAEEVEEAVRLLVARQRVRRPNDGTVQQHPGDVTAADLRAKLDGLEARVGTLVPVLGADRVTSLRAGVSLTRQRLAGQPDDITLDRAQHELQDSTSVLGEAVRTAWQRKLEYLRNVRVTVADSRTGLRVAEAEKVIVGAITIIVPIDETRRKLIALVKTCDEALGKADAEVVRLIGLAGPTDAAAITLFNDAAVVDASLAAERARAAQLGKLVETLTHWRAIVEAAGALAPEPGTPEAIQFEREISAPILLHLARRNPELLAQYEYFKARVDERKRERDRIEGEVRAEFERTRATYETCIRGFVEAHALLTPANVANLAGAYGALRVEVVGKVRPWIEQRTADAGRLLNDLHFLQSERRIDVGDFPKQLEEACALLTGVGAGLAEAASTPEGLGAAIDRLKGVRDSVIGPARSRYEELRTRVDSPDAAEERVLDAFKKARAPRPSDPVSIEAVRRANVAGQPLEELLAIIGKLYRKGHVEIQIRLR